MFKYIYIYIYIYILAHIEFEHDSGMCACFFFNANMLPEYEHMPMLPEYEQSPRPAAPQAPGRRPSAPKPRRSTLVY